MSIESDTTSNQTTPQTTPKKRMIDMKVIGQDEDGRIIIDGEGEIVHIKKAIPGDSPAFLTNFTFIDTQAEIDEAFGRIATVIENISKPTDDLFEFEDIESIRDTAARIQSNIDRLDSHLSDLRKMVRDKKTMKSMEIVNGG